MLTNAARGGLQPRAPRSFSSVRRHGVVRGTLVLLAAVMATASGCEDQGPTGLGDATFAAELSGAPRKALYGGEPDTNPTE